MQKMGWFWVVKGHSDHKAVIAYTGAPSRQLNKTRERRVFRRRSPSQHALCLQHAPAVTFEFHDGASVQSNFDVMYTIIVGGVAQW